MLSQLQQVVLAIVPLIMSSSSEMGSPARTFTADPSGFLMDGQPFKYAAGELHYFRIPRPYWADRIRKTHAAGFNVIQTAVEWSSHEPEIGHFNFADNLDLEGFIRLAEKEGMYVIVRAGPYIGLDRDFGGLPYWLMRENPLMRPRTSDSSFMKFAQTWLEVLLGRLSPLLYGNGGPVIMVQIENNYGSYPRYDRSYPVKLSTIFKKFVKPDTAVLFTKDKGVASTIKKGHIAGAVPTTGFGSGTTDLSSAFLGVRRLQVSRPEVNSHLPSGWRSYWGDKLANVTSSSLASIMKAMLRDNTSFALYLAHGGTNFGFSAGSNSNPTPQGAQINFRIISNPTDEDYRPVVTSYDYGAPISEGGDLTEKYFSIKEALKEFFPVQDINCSCSRGDYGTVIFTPVISLLDGPGVEMHEKEPPSFEELSQSSGFVAYTTEIPSSPFPLEIEAEFRDRAILFVDRVKVATGSFRLKKALRGGSFVTILVENSGRRSNGNLRATRKGLVSASVNGRDLENWKVNGYPNSQEDIRRVKNLPRVFNATPPAYFNGSFLIPEGEDPKDTYFDMTGWGKGILYLNEVNLGRYWTVGPYLTLYAPGCYMKKFPELNTVVIMELQRVPHDKAMRMSKSPLTRH